MALTTCPECGKEVSDQAVACPACGYPIHKPSATEKPATQTVVTVRKSRGVYIVLGLFFGLLGAHNFYAGYYWQGIVQLVLGGLLFWTYIGPFIVIVWILCDLIAETHDASGIKMA